MSYLVLARKFRPLTFDQVSGQEHVTRTLKNSIKSDKVAHAYLFAGPRGVGKTSVARIYAKALNCETGPSATPCLKCTNCREISQGNNLAVREIDGASHNSVDNVRELIESFRSAPPPGSKYKIYIIDEVHMLSTAAFNALLKSLEEPPPNTVFILATTEAHKIPGTVISRCQRHDFRILAQRDIESRLEEIVDQEGIEAQPEALRMIARLSDGSMRDSQSLLERVRAFCGDKISAEDASRLLGTVQRRALFQLSEAILGQEPARCLKIAADIFSVGVDPGLFLREFVLHFRELLIAKFAGEQGLESFGLSQDEVVELKRQSSPLSAQDIQDLVHLAREGADSAIRSVYPKYALEALVVRMATREKVHNLSEIIQRISESGAESGRSGSASINSVTAAPLPAAAKIKRTDAETGRDTDGDSGPERNVEKVALEWSDLVRSILEGGAKILGEHMKRLTVKTFKKGVLDASGPEFSIASLKESSNKKKLLDALQSFCSVKEGWDVKLTPSAAGEGSNATTLLQQEQVERTRISQKKKSDLTNHPKIKSLKEAFPGSSIENILIKDMED